MCSLNAEGVHVTAKRSNRRSSPVGGCHVRRSARKAYGCLSEATLQQRLFGPGTALQWSRVFCARNNRTFAAFDLHYSLRHPAFPQVSKSV